MVWGVRDVTAYYTPTDFQPESWLNTGNLAEALETWE